MSEKPILFSAPMVRAILDGRKTQTRRIVKPQPEPGEYGWTWPSNKARSMVEIRDMGCLGPYSADRLWVRETWQTAKCFDAKSPSAIAAMALDAGYQRPWGPARYLVDGADNGVPIRDFDGEWGKTRVSIHMPRWASRITLEVTGVRVERLQNISEEDAKAEGVDAISLDDVPRDAAWSARQDFAALWDSINAKRAPWASNPWVWVVEFKRVSP